MNNAALVPQIYALPLEDFHQIFSYIEREEDVKAVLVVSKVFNEIGLTIVEWRRKIVNTTSFVFAVRNMSTNTYLFPFLMSMENEFHHIEYRPVLYSACYAYKQQAEGEVKNRIHSAISSLLQNQRVPVDYILKTILKAMIKQWDDAAGINMLLQEPLVASAITTYEQKVSLIATAFDEDHLNAAKVLLDHFGIDQLGYFYGLVLSARDSKRSNEAIKLLVEEANLRSPQCLGIIADGLSCSAKDLQLFTQDVGSDPKGRDIAFKQAVIISDTCVMDLLDEPGFVLKNNHDEYLLLASNSKIATVLLYLLEDRRIVKTAAGCRKALLNAVKKGIKEPVKLLLKHAKIDLKANDYEVFALAAASVKSNGSYSDYSILDRLLKQPNIDRSKALFVVLQAAIDTDEFDLFSRVLNVKRFRLPTDNRPLCSAAAKGHVKMLKLLLDDKRFNPAANDNEALMAAVKAGQIESVEILLNDRRVNPAANGNEALRLAASRGSAAIVQLLLLYGVNPAADSNQAVLLAAKNGHTAILDLLLNYRQVDFRVINPSAVSPKTREWLRLHNDELKQRQTENRAFKQ